MAINDVDIRNFGHLLEPRATRQDLVDGVGLLERAMAAADQENKTIEETLGKPFRLGRGRKYLA